MSIHAYWLAAAVLVLSWLITAWTRHIALASGLLDHPNVRSSHSQPTPRGGGLAIVIASLLGFGLLLIYRMVPLSMGIALLGGGIAVAIVGFLDDRYQLPAAFRLAVHLCAALWALGWLDGLPPLRVGEETIDLGGLGYLLGAIGIVWTLNLFNFMDGIDGIAGAEAIFISVAGALLALAGETSGAVGAAALLFSAACLGFLLWNWPPAKIFMGDVGSGYLGYVVAVLAIVDGYENPSALFVWAILGSVFLVDATVTLVRRLSRGERVHQAHRSHAYQWLARRWNSHRRVTMCVIALNIFWLLPAAWLATLFPALAPWIMLGAQIPLVILALAAGSGRAEHSNPLASKS